MVNAYGYVRVSTKEQSYDSQMDAIKMYCKLKEYELVKIFDDKYSGKNTDRPGFQNMMTTLDKNPQNIEIVVVTKFDRIGRNIRDLLKFTDWCESHSIGVAAIGNNVDTKTKEGRLAFYVFGIIAEYEREMIVERTTLGKERYVAGGGKFGHPKRKLPKDEIKRLFDEGVPVTEIARRFACSTPTIYDRLVESGYEFKPVVKR